MGPNDTPVPFQANKVGQWTSTLVENVLKELAEKNSEAAKNGQQKFIILAECILCTKWRNG